jgi:hypothetical protein
MIGQNNLIRNLDPKKSPQAQVETDIIRKWSELAESSPPRGSYEKELALALYELGCKGEANGYILHGLLHGLNDRFQQERGGRARGRRAGAKDDLQELTAKFYDEENCPAARDLPTEDKLAWTIGQAVAKAIRSLPIP